MEWKFKKNEKLNKVILMALVGLLLLILVVPSQRISTGTADSASDSVSGTEQTVSSYEERLRALLSDTYGEGTVDVMIYSESATQGYYDSRQKEEITGVLITICASAVSDTTISDITLSVCALFDLPAHKVAVLVKK